MTPQHETSGRTRPVQATGPRLSQGLPQPGFVSMASSTLFGPPVDVSMGWDGTVWGMDASGGPHLYDPARDLWIPHGEGVDAAAQSAGKVYVFRGDQVLENLPGGTAGTPQPIAVRFPDLPDSFKLSVTGAASAPDGTVFVFKGGWYIPVDASRPKARLLDLKNWPQAAAWADGVIDSAWADCDGGNICLARGGQCIQVDLNAGQVLDQPQSIASLPAWSLTLPAEWLADGIDAAFAWPVSGDVHWMVFRGPAIAVFTERDTGPAPVSYIGAANPGWPATWNPILTHAPSGRVGDLWIAALAAPGDTGGPVAHHDGQSWTVMTDTFATSVSAGADGTVLSANPGTQPCLFSWTRAAGWSPFPQMPPQLLVQVATGNAGLVWARSEDGTVYRADPSAGFTPSADVGTASHIAASPDGTVWHCRTEDANAYCFISEMMGHPPAAISVQDGTVTAVQRVASTGYGQAYVLAKLSTGDVGLFRYNSPFTFKTSQAWSIGGSQSLIRGHGRLYGQSTTNPSDWPGNLATRFVALDAHTGQQFATYEMPYNANGAMVQYSGMVFDPVNNLVYVGAAPYINPTGIEFDASTPGAILAFDGDDLSLRWTYAPSELKGVDATPALHGTKLCFGDRSGTLRMIDTRKALAAAPDTEWTWTPTTPFGSGTTLHLSSTPLLTGGMLYCTIWDLSTHAPSGDQAGCMLSVASCAVADGSTQAVSGNLHQVDLTFYLYGCVSQPVLGRARAADGATEIAALYLNGFNRILAQSLDPALQPANTSFALPAGNINTDLAYDDGSRAGAGLQPTVPPSGIRIWFGDTEGNLWSLGDWLHPADQTPHQVLSATAVTTTPVLYKDQQGGVTVLFGLEGSTSPWPDMPDLYGYDPTNGNLAAIPTGVTGLSVLLPGASGMVYTGGYYTAPEASCTQLFGLRVDALPQLLRDFVVDSQMQQDPDPTAPGGDVSDKNNPVPPSRARYQTHLTVVDDQKSPIPREPLKVWADQPTTILVDGVSYPIGPGDTDFASLRTGGDGAIVIASGYARTDASDKPTMYAPALRVWAAFMDPFERLIVNPDHAFHQRISTAHDNAGDDDPDKVNLVTTQSYAGVKGAKPTPLFTTAECSAGQPGNCANAIGQMRSGVGFGGAGNTTASLHARLMRRSGGSKSARRHRASAAPPLTGAIKYLAANQSGGVGLFPTNIPATRPVTILQPTGLALNKPHGAPPSAATLDILDHTAAQARFDALPPSSANPPWATTGAQRGGHQVGNIFTDFWNWLVNAVETIVVEITDVVVSIADEVMVGIRMLVNGIEQVFKAIVKVIDDIASAIGSFFQMLAKIIEDVIAALGVLFHFGEIMWTHTWLSQQTNQRFSDLSNALTTTIKPGVDGFFESGEAGIKSLFDGLRQQLGAGDQIGAMKGMGATTQSAFTIGPRGGSPSSHATQCGYGLQKLKSGAPSAQGGSSLVAVRQGSDPISDFFSAFAARLESDPTLNAAMGQFSGDFNTLLTAQSASEFFSTLLLTLLDMLETLFIGALAIANALVDGFLAVIGDAISAIQTMLNDPIEIPVLSWLYQLLFNEQLTFLHLVTLVAAIPLTIIFRVVEGQYPSAVLGSSGRSENLAVGAAPPLIQRYLGVFAGMLAMAEGMVNALGDVEGDSAPDVVSKISLGIGLVIQGFSFPLIYSDADTLSPSDWAAFGIGMSATLIQIGGVSYEGDGGSTSLLPAPVMSGLTAVLGCASLASTIAAFIEDKATDPITDLGFVAGLVGAIPSMVNPLKLAPEPVPLVLGAIDAVGGIVAGGIEIAKAVFSTGDAPPDGLPA